jgi:hypothetical protein
VILFLLWVKGTITDESYDDKFKIKNSNISEYLANKSKNYALTIIINA